MTSDEYVFQVLQKYQDSKNEILQVETLANNIAKDLTVWANDCLGNISFSGAFAKGTTIKGSSDVGLFISLKSNRCQFWTWAERTPLPCQGGVPLSPK